MTAAQSALRIPMVEVPPERARGLGALELLGPAGRITLPLATVSITARVAGAVAEVTLRQVFRNPHPEPLAAEYVFPLPGGAAVSKFELRVAGRVVVGQVKERSEARRDYAEAIAQGKRAALLEQERGDVFTVSVGNLPPGETAELVISWSERLPVFEDGRAELRLPLVVAPRYIAGAPEGGPQAGSGVAEDTALVPDASRISPPRLAPGFDPGVALALSVELLASGALEELCCSQHAVQQRGASGAIQIELAREGERLDRDFVLRWRMAGAAVQPELLVYRPAEGDAYALLTLLPPKRDGFLGLPRDVVFVLDRSGSMEGLKMVWAARACAQLLRTLGPRDRFAIQAFDNAVEWLDQPHRGRWLQADERGLEAGEKYLRTIAARGGTELDGAIGAALELLAGRGLPAKAAARKSDAPAAPQGAPILVLLTDGQIGDEASVLRRLQLQLGEARVFTVGIDTAVNAAFLTRLAALGGGTASLVEPGARLEDALRGVAREIGAPLVTDLQISAPDLLEWKGGLPAGSLAPAHLPDLFAGRPAAAFLRLAQPVPLTITGAHADGSRFTQSVLPREVPLPALAQLWAKARIAELEDQYRLSLAGAAAIPSEQLSAEIVALSVKHLILTRFTAFVAVDQEVVNPGGQGRKLVQPVEQPHGWDLESAFDKSGHLGAMPLQASTAAPAGMPSFAPPAPPAMRSAAPMAHKVAAVASHALSAFGGLLKGGGGSASSGSGPADAQRALLKPAGAPSPSPTSGKSKRRREQSKHDDAEDLLDGAPEPVAADPALGAALDALAGALEQARSALAAGAVPDAGPVEAARTALLHLLAAASVGVEVAALQRLLRSGLLELVAALHTPGTPVAALLALCIAREQELVAARAALGGASGGSPKGRKGGAFWGASV